MCRGAKYGYRITQNSGKKSKQKSLTFTGVEK